MSFLNKLFGEKSALDSYKTELLEVNSFKEEIAGLTQEQIQAEITNFKQEFSKLQTKEEIKEKILEVRTRVFALVREAGKRTLGQTHYDVQIVGGLALSDNKISEMKTGEGKTLTATLPLVLYALAGKGAHLVTVNDYLARWQASLIGPLFKFLGLSVASIQHEASFLYDPEYKPEDEEVKKLEGETQGLVLDVKHMRPITRKEAYASDITYGTNNEFGFDYLRDNMVQHFSQMTQRDLFFAIVDEVDSILIDEARTPLIISTPDAEPDFSSRHNGANQIQANLPITDANGALQSKLFSARGATVNKHVKLLQAVIESFVREAPDAREGIKRAADFFTRPLSKQEIVDRTKKIAEFDAKSATRIARGLADNRGMFFEDDKLPGAFILGPKFGCGMGQCGACTVHVDGDALRSCVTPAAAVGNARITTIEGIADLVLIRLGYHPAQSRRPAGGGTNSHRCGSPTRSSSSASEIN
jgi:preprotein translocase subunit SecA